MRGEPRGPRRLVAECSATGCAKPAVGLGGGQTRRLFAPRARWVCSPMCGERTEPVAPWWLRLTQWSCEDDCKYLCMRQHTEQRRALGQPVLKYHGKWPFVRVLGVQEVASVVFSVLVFATHVHGVLRLQRAVTALQCPQGYVYSPLLQVHCLVNLNGWLWSAVFHSRDVELTEKLDYLSANLIVFNGVSLCAIRMLALRRPAQWMAAAAPVAAAMALHFYYMLFVKFDYGWNMKLCILLGAAQSFAWVIWSMRVNHPARWTFLAFTVGMHAAMILEVLDFPPVFGLLDAHSAWHAVTPPFVYIWYSMFIEDAKWASGGKLKDS